MSSFLPAYFERAVTEAVAENAELAFLHSHLGPGWQGMSDDDVRAEQTHAAAAKGATGLPLVGLTLGTDGAWSARFWEKTSPRVYERRWCTHVRVVGERLSVAYADHLIYHALQANVTKRMSNGLMFQAAYTWAHAIDNSSDPLTPAAGNNEFPRNSLNLAAERGNSDFDASDTGWCSTTPGRFPSVVGMTT